MKYIFPILLAAAGLMGCDKEKNAIDSETRTTQESLERQKDALDAAANAAKKEAEANAEAAKARIEANKEAAKAELEAEKKKAAAQAEFEKAKADALKQ